MDKLLVEPSVDADVFGVNPETKDMNICEFYSYLLKLYDNDRVKIREFLRTLGSDTYTCGFMHDPMFGKTYDTMTPEDQLDFCTKLEQLNHGWHDIGYVSEIHLANEFMENRILRESYINSIVVVKYYEQYGARFWQNKWAKEMRGTVLIINPETNKIKCAIKLERGAEVVTGMVSAMGLETQDVRPGKIKILDPEQQDTCTRLCTGQEINMHLTSKGDGSLLVITSYIGIYKNVMKHVVDIFGSFYAKLWVNLSLSLSNGKRILIPSTQGTVMESGFMAPYMVTSMLVGSGIISRDLLYDLWKNHNYDYVTVFALYGTDMISRLLKFRFFDELTDIQTFSFEAMCMNRCGLLDDAPHIELACSYHRDRLIFLGTSICDKRFYIPHSMYRDVSDIPFEEPLWWKITHADQVNRMVDDIGQIVLGKMCKIEFLERNPPSNPDFDIKFDIELDAKAEIDYEGWVAMKVANLEIVDPDHLEVIKYFDNKIPRTIYSKIKTEPYYRSHKYHEENIPYLIELAKTAGDIFPLARKLAGICAPGAISDRLRVVGVRTMKLLNFSEPDNQIMPLLHQAFKETLESIPPGSKIPKDPLVGFESRPFNVQCRMALNFKGFDFGALLIPIYTELFPEIDPTFPDLNPVCRGLTMSLEPWNPGYEDRIRELNPKSTSVKGLITACIGASVM